MHNTTESTKQKQAWPVRIQRSFLALSRQAVESKDFRGRKRVGFGTFHWPTRSRLCLRHGCCKILRGVCSLQLCEAVGGGGAQKTVRPKTFRSNTEVRT